MGRRNDLAFREIKRGGLSLQDVRLASVVARSLYGGEGSALRPEEGSLDRRRVFQVVAVLAAVLAYLTIVIGGDLTASGAGFACGDSWPFCPGGIIPDLSNPQVAIEFTHRVVAFATSLLILIELVLAFLWYRKEGLIFYLAGTTFLLLLAQVILGMVTVQSDLNAGVVTAHLAIGTATFAAALVLSVVLFLRPPPAPSLSAAPS